MCVLKHTVQLRRRLRSRIKSEGMGEGVRKCTEPNLSVPHAAAAATENATDKKINLEIDWRNDSVSKGSTAFMSVRLCVSTEETSRGNSSALHPNVDERVFCFPCLVLWDAIVGGEA